MISKTEYDLIAAGKLASNHGYDIGFKEHDGQLLWLLWDPEGNEFDFTDWFDMLDWCQTNN